MVERSPALLPTSASRDGRIPFIIGSARFCSATWSCARRDRIKVKLRINEQITAREVRLIGANSEQLGVVSLPEALDKARQAGLDLCEIASTARPPVVKIMDFGKYKYELQKKLKEARKKQKVIQVKEVKLSPKISEHDYLTKMAQAKRFLGEGDKVKVTMIFRGRENAHPEFGERIITRVLEECKTFALIDRSPKYEGNQLNVVLSPTS